MKHLALAVFWAVAARPQATAPEPPEAMTHARRAYDLSREGKFDQAVADLSEAARLAPANPLYRSALGGLYERDGKLAQAAASFAEAVSLDPDNVRLRLRLATIQSQTSQFESARTNLLKVLEKQPGEASATALLESVSLEWGAELARSRRYRAGLALARDTSARFARSASVHLMLGLFEARNQLNLNAVAAYRRALELEPQSAEALVGLGVAQSSAGLLQEAQATFEEGVKKFPTEAACRQAYGALLVKMADSGAVPLTRAIKMLESALKLDPSLAEAHYQLGNLALAADDAAAAAVHFAAASSNGLDDSRLHYAAARAQRRLGHQVEADHHLALFRARKSAEQSAGSEQ